MALCVVVKSELSELGEVRVGLCVPRPSSRLGAEDAVEKYLGGAAKLPYNLLQSSP